MAVAQVVFVGGGETVAVMSYVPVGDGATEPAASTTDCSASVGLVYTSDSGWSAPAAFDEAAHALAAHVSITRSAASSPPRGVIVAKTVLRGGSVTR